LKGGSLYIIGLTGSRLSKALDGKLFHAMKDPSCRHFDGVLNSVSNTLTSVLTLVKVPLSGVLLVNLELHPWVPQQVPLTRVLCAFPYTEYTISVLFIGTS
jgi:hypothetical protein